MSKPTFTSTAARKKTRRPPRTARQKLVDAVAHARGELLDAAHAARSMYPSAALTDPFGRYSRALRSLVSYHLSLPAWDVASTSDTTSSWTWDPRDARFYFDYEGFADLPRADADYVGAPSLRPRLRCAAHLTFDPEQPLDVELARVAREAKHYRDCVTIMEREVYRLVVRAEAASPTDETRP